MTSPHRQANQSIVHAETPRTPMFGSPRIAPTDWKLRYDNLHYEHQLEMERLRLHYEHQLKERVSGFVFLSSIYVNESTRKLFIFASISFQRQEIN